MIKPACDQAVCKKLNLPPPSDIDESNDDDDTDIIMDDPVFFIMGPQNARYGTTK